MTVDPPGSTDLDQAMHLERRGDGFGVDYAIADVPAFVAPGGPVDAEARRRGQTLYAPDQRTPLHPPVAQRGRGEPAGGAGPPGLRLAVRPGRRRRRDGHATWSRAMVRSRHRLDYGQVQAAADATPAARPTPTSVARQAVLLREVGVRRMALEEARGGANLPLPEQEVTAVDGRYALTLRPASPAEDWNAQLSLHDRDGRGAAHARRPASGCCGRCPRRTRRLVARFRLQAQALGVAWPAGTSLGAFLRGCGGTSRASWR